MESVTLFGQLDDNGASVFRDLAPADEAELLEPVEVTRQGRRLDPDGGREVGAANASSHS